MSDRLLSIALRHGVFLRSEARDLGYGDKAVTAMLRGHVWVRVRHGSYTLAEIWDAADDRERHRIRALAVMRSHGDRVALSHVSSLVVQDVAVWGVELGRVHVTRLDGGVGRIERDVVHHEGLCLTEDLVRHSGLWLTKPARAVLETSQKAPVEAALVSADSALHLGITNPDELAETYAGISRWPHTQKTHVVLGLADGRAESVGETRSRYLFWCEGLPEPTLQHHAYDDHGNLLGITDFAWLEDGLLGEFDGKVKYGRLLKPGQEPGDVVFEEKKREDLLREHTGMGMFRVVWADLYRSRNTAARASRLMRRPA